MSGTPYKARIEHAWNNGRCFDLWVENYGTETERHVFCIDAAAVCTGTLQDCKGAWIREWARVQKGAAK